MNFEALLLNKQSSKQKNRHSSVGGRKELTLPDKSVSAAAVSATASVVSDALLSNCVIIMNCCLVWGDSYRVRMFSCAWFLQVHIFIKRELPARYSKVLNVVNTCVICWAKTSHFCSNNKKNLIYHKSVEICWAKYTHTS